MRRFFCCLIALGCTVSLFAGDRVPGEHWQEYLDPADAGFADADTIARAAVVAAVADEMAKADSFLSLVEGDDSIRVGVARAAVDILRGRRKKGARAIGDLVEAGGGGRVERMVNWIGSSLVDSERPEAALVFFKLNTELFPDSSNAWDSLGECYLQLGKDNKAIASYEKSLELKPGNQNASEMIARIRGRPAPE